MRTTLILGGTGAGLLAAAVAVWAFWPGEAAPPRTLVAVEAPADAIPPSPTSASRPTGDAPADQVASLPPVLSAIQADDDPALSPPPSADRPSLREEPVAAGDPSPERPAFDALRLGRFGDVFIAGRSQPGAEVRVLADGAEIGREIADARGEWVFAGTVELSPGAYELSLSAMADGERPIASDEVVVLVVPGGDGEPTGTQEPALALLTARDDLAASRILQAPEHSVGSAPAPAATRVDLPETTAAALRSAPATGIGDGDWLPAEAAGPDGPTADEEIVALQEQYAGSATHAMPDDAEPTPGRAPASTGDPVRHTASDPGRPAGLIAGPPAVPVAEDVAAAVAIQVIDYDDRGRVIVSGQAAGPFARVRLYLDGLPVGAAVADAAGAFRAFLDQQVAPGRYRLRLDSLADDDVVAARAELPFERADIVLDAAGRRVVIQPGNNLWTIARYVYGSGFRYTAIYSANREAIRDPHLIFPGQVFSLPEGRQDG